MKKPEYFREYGKSSSHGLKLLKGSKTSGFSQKQQKKSNIIIIDLK